MSDAVPGHEGERVSLPRARRCAEASWRYLALLALIAACGSDSPAILPPTRNAIALQVNGPGQVTPQTQAQFTAIQTWSDGSSVDVTASAQWTSTNPSVLS